MSDKTKYDRNPELESPSQVIGYMKNLRDDENVECVSDIELSFEVKR